MQRHWIRYFRILSFEGKYGYKTLFHSVTIAIFTSQIKPLMNKQFKILMLEAEKKVYEQVLNNQQSHLGQSEIDELLDLLLEINR